MSRILVVDDERNVLSSFEKILSRDGYDVITASSGERALALMQSKAPDLVILDIRLAGLSGLQVLKRMHAMAPQLPIIIMTAFSTTETAMEAIKLGAFEYLLKPFEVPTLKVLVKMALGQGQGTAADGANA